MSREWKSDTEAFVYTKDDFTYGCIDDSSDTFPSDPITVTRIPLGYDGITIILKIDSPIFECLKNALSLSDLRWIYSNASDSYLNETFRVYQNIVLMMSPIVHGVKLTFHVLMSGLNYLVLIVSQVHIHFFNQ